MKLGNRRERDALSHNVSKSEQAIKVLFANPVFKLMIKRLREKWGVNEGNPEREKNMRKIAWRISERYSKHELQRGVGKNRTKGIQPSGLFYKDIIELMRQFKLDKEYWFISLWEYVRTGSADIQLTHDALYMDTAPVIRPYTQPETGKRKIIMELGEKTTLKDVKAMWHRVEEARKMLFPKRPKFKPWKNLERDSKVYTFYLEDKTLPEIANAIDKEYGGDLTETNIRKIIITYRNRFGLLDEKKKLVSSLNPKRTRR